MKKVVILFILSLVAVAAMAQTNQYPNPSGTITKSGYTYKYRNGIISGVEVATRIELYNASSKFLDVPWTYKNGAQKSEGEALGYYQESYYYNYRSQTYDQLRSIVAGLFTSQHKTMLKGSTMLVVALVDPSTGKVVDVYFSFRRSYPLMNIPVEIFRSIELAIKEKLTITATANGRKFNYLDFSWQQQF
jgi:hypothetical protein